MYRTASAVNIGEFNLKSSHVLIYNPIFISIAFFDDMDKREESSVASAMED
jgi:hypothetical protein